MSELFRGWRRKIGCATLVMACAFAGLRVRSASLADVISFCRGDICYELISYGGRFECRTKKWLMSEPNASQARVPLVRQFKWRNPEIRIESDPLEVFKVAKLGHWQEFLGCGVGTLNFDSPASASDGPVPYQARYQVWVVRYPSVSIPLTLLSAYLILWKPRSQQKTPVQPANSNVNAN